MTETTKLIEATCPTPRRTLRAKAETKRLQAVEIRSILERLERF